MLKYNTGDNEIDHEFQFERKMKIVENRCRVKVQKSSEKTKQFLMCIMIEMSMNNNKRLMSNELVSTMGKTQRRKIGVKSTKTHTRTSKGKNCVLNLYPFKISRKIKCERESLMFCVCMKMRCWTVSNGSNLPLPQKMILVWFAF